MATVDFNISANYYALSALNSAVNSASTLAGVVTAFNSTVGVVYGLNLRLTTTFPFTGYTHVDITEDDLDHAKICVLGIASALSHYPPAYVQALTLTDLTLAKSIGDTTGRITVAALTSVDEMVWAVTTIADVAQAVHTLHHEMMHSAQNTDQAFWNNPGAGRWLAVNPGPYLGIGTQGTSATNTPTGYASNYGMTNLAEDGAEVMTMLWEPNSNLYGRLDTDRALKTKVDLLVGWFKGFIAGLGTVHGPPGSTTTTVPKLVVAVDGANRLGQAANVTLTLPPYPGVSYTPPTPEHYTDTPSLDIGKEVTAYGPSSAGANDSIPRISYTLLSDTRYTTVDRHYRDGSTRVATFKVKFLVDQFGANDDFQGFELVIPSPYQPFYGRLFGAAGTEVTTPYYYQGTGGDPQQNVWVLRESAHPANEVDRFLFGTSNFVPAGPGIPAQTVSNLLQTTVHFTGLAHSEPDLPELGDLVQISGPTTIRVSFQDCSAHGETGILRPIEEIRISAVGVNAMGQGAPVVQARWFLNTWADDGALLGPPYPGYEGRRPHRYDYYARQWYEYVWWMDTGTYNPDFTDDAPRQRLVEFFRYRYNTTGPDDESTASRTLPNPWNGLVVDVSLPMKPGVRLAGFAVEGIHYQEDKNYIHDVLFAAKLLPARPGSNGGWGGGGWSFDFGDSTAPVTTNLFTASKYVMPGTYTAVASSHVNMAPTGPPDVITTRLAVGHILYTWFGNPYTAGVNMMASEARYLGWIAPQPDGSSIQQAATIQTSTTDLGLLFFNGNYADFYDLEQGYFPDPLPAPIFRIYRAGFDPGTDDTFVVKGTYTVDAPPAPPSLPAYGKLDAQYVGVRSHFR